MTESSYSLSVEQLGELAEKTLANARDLLNEGKALGNLGHYPRAFSLAVLAAEEFGKHLMCFGAIGLRSDDDEQWQDFQKRFRTHTPKYENVFAMAIAVLPATASEKDAYMAKMNEHVRADQDRKLAGFYVDLDEDGHAVHPAEAIGPDLVYGAIIVYDELISFWESLYAGADFAAVFADGLERGAEELRYALLNDDEETVARFFSHREEEDAPAEPGDARNRRSADGPLTRPPSQR